jgi:hypothetical protein
MWKNMQNNIKTSEGVLTLEARLIQTKCVLLDSFDVFVKAHGRLEQFWAHAKEHVKEKERT